MEEEDNFRDRIEKLSRRVIYVTIEAGVAGWLIIAVIRFLIHSWYVLK